MNPETLGQRIRQAREAKGLMQKQLGSLVGKSESAVSQWENGGIREIKGATLGKLASELGVSIDWLLSGEVEDHTRICGKIADYWPHLTARQRAQIEAEAEAMAQHNIELLAELGKK